MAFTGVRNYSHAQPDKTGILITNLGTPDAPETGAVRRYLREFLSDHRVVEIPKAIWWFILNGIILLLRPARSAKNYRTVWTERGSPLLYHTADQCAAIRQYMQGRYGDDVVVEFAMRYGNPAITDVLQKMQDQGVRRLLVLPMYPQYSATTTASTFDAIAHDFAQRRWIPELRFINHYHDFPPYIEAMAEHIEAFQKINGSPEKLVLSYHGIPKRNLLEGDPYHCECYKTSRLLAERLGLPREQVLTTFQSRFGKQEWLKPYTDATMKQLGAEGVGSLQVFCPGFPADCLETIEEIAEENKHYFEEAGGKNFAYIPALNAEPHHIHALTALLEQHLKGWHPLGNSDKELTVAEANAKGA
ncbi:ferrochelatase [Salinispirillum marinum]|uniref:Ferrochelatase n=2 Tax=Saccharospirillaceae TaxID=255527 RepID=A0ABV8BJ50_9GAMM